MPSVVRNNYMYVEVQHISNFFVKFYILGWLAAGQNHKIPGSRSSDAATFDVILNKCMRRVFQEIYL